MWGWMDTWKCISPQFKMEDIPQVRSQVGWRIYMPDLESIKLDHDLILTAHLSLSLNTQLRCHLLGKPSLTSQVGLSTASSDLLQFHTCISDQGLQTLFSDGRTGCSFYETISF